MMNSKIKSYNLKIKVIKAKIYLNQPIKKIHKNLLT